MIVCVSVPNRVVVTIAVRSVRRLAVEVIVVAIVVAIAGGGVQAAVQAVARAVRGHTRRDAIQNAMRIAQALLLQRSSWWVSCVPTSGGISTVNVTVVDIPVAVEPWTNRVAYDGIEK